MKRLLFCLLVVVAANGCSKQTMNDCKGPARTDCVCTMQYDPVCGCDNKTYSNACMAGCEGVKQWKPGACP